MEILDRLKKKTGKNKSIAFVVNEELADFIDDICKKHNVSTSELMRHLVENLKEEYEKKQTTVCKTKE